MIRFSPLANQAHIIPWQEWSDAAFRGAHAENKPVMLFLSAFWCRFCQRMDEQAFSDTEVIALLNAYFIPLRVEYAQPRCTLGQNANDSFESWEHRKRLAAVTCCSSRVDH
jgi:thioredoxin-related protein